MKIEIDYSKYSYEELIDAATHIDSNAYPDRMAQINIELDKHKHKQDLDGEPFLKPPTKDFNDDFAKQIDWSPLEDKCSSYKTHHLNQVSDSRIEYRASASMKLYSLISILLGIGMTFFILYSEESNLLVVITILAICSSIYWFFLERNLWLSIKPKEYFLKVESKLEISITAL